MDVVYCFTAHSSAFVIISRLWLFSRSPCILPTAKMAWWMADSWTLARRITSSQSKPKSPDTYWMLLDRKYLSDALALSSSSLDWGGNPRLVGAEMGVIISQETGEDEVEEKPSHVRPVDVQLRQAGQVSSRHQPYKSVIAIS